MIWILDDGPLQILANCVSAESMRTWPSGELVVAAATREAASLDKSGRRKQVLEVSCDDGGEVVISSFDVTVASPAGEVLYRHLRVGAEGTANLAEHQALAWMIAVEDDATLVTMDKAAAYLGLSEVGRGKVSHPYELWEYLRSESRVSENEYELLIEQTRKRETSLPGVPWRITRGGGDVPTSPGD